MPSQAIKPAFLSTKSPFINSDTCNQSNTKLDHETYA